MILSEFHTRAHTSRIKKLITTTTKANKKKNKRKQILIKCGERTSVLCTL